MKAMHTISIIAVFAAAIMTGYTQDYPEEYLGLPGDNLNLYAVMNLFQESETLEGFERSLNDQETTINNLDLNGDKLVDYITVSDYVDKEVHTIVLRTALTGNEQQDIAVFVVEKLRNGPVQIQLIGDEALYGTNYIVEPIYAETPNPGYTGNTNSSNANVVSATYNDIAAWPVIMFMYRPGYSVWRSSWNWGYYPGYWNPWRPHYWHYYYGYHSHRHDHYYRHYRHWDHYRSRSYNTFYHSHRRVHSPTVVVNINNNRYKSTYSRPDQRRAGEERYTRTSNSRTNTNRTGEVSGRQGVKRTEAPSNRSRSSVSTSQRKKDAVRGTSTQRNTSPRTGTTRTSHDRSSKSKNSPSVSRSSSSKSKSRPSVSRSSSKSSKPSVSRSSSKSSKPSVSRTSPSKSKSSSKKSSSSSRKSSSSKKSSSRSSSSSRR